MKVLSVILRLLVAIILAQTLFFKFSAAPESVFIFETVGMEPNGRILIGVLELIAVVLILLPKTKVFGALLTVGIIGGAIMMHLTQLGIEVQGDGGMLFYLALITLVASLILLIIHRSEIPIINKWLVKH